MLLLSRTTTYRLLALSICLATATTPSLALADSSGHAVISVLDIEANSMHRDEAEYWYGVVVEALDGLTSVTARRDPIPGASALPLRDFEQDLLRVERAHAAARSSLRQGDWLAAVRLSEDALTLAARFDSPPLPGTLLRDVYLLQARALLKGQRTEQARAAMASARGLDPYWEPTPCGLDPQFRSLFEGLQDEAIKGPAGTLAVVSRQQDTQVMIEGVTQGWLNGRQFSISLPVGEYTVTSRSTGRADRTDQVVIRADERTALFVKLHTGSSSAFHPSLMQALARPSEQRGTAVWRELENARTTLGSDSILAARYSDGSGGFEGLVVGLYLPGRNGWSFYRKIPLSHDFARDSLQLEKLSDDLLLAVDQQLVDGVARR